MNTRRPSPVDELSFVRNADEKKDVHPILENALEAADRTLEEEPQSPSPTSSKAMPDRRYSCFRASSGVF